MTLPRDQVGKKESGGASVFDRFFSSQCLCEQTKIRPPVALHRGSSKPPIAGILEAQFLPNHAAIMG